jgi:hypothetical protein
MPVIAINAEFLVSLNRNFFCHALIVRTIFFCVKAVFSSDCFSLCKRIALAKGFHYSS